MTGRRYCTPAEKQALSDKQDGLCAICGEPLGLGGPTEADHTTPHALRPERKPDALVHKSCHALKSKDDVRRIAKAKRQARLSAIRTLSREVRKRKLQGRPFPKIKRALGDLRFKRKMDGSVVPRSAAT